MSGFRFYILARQALVNHSLIMGQLFFRREIIDCLYLWSNIALFPSLTESQIQVILALHSSL